MEEIEAFKQSLATVYKDNTVIRFSKIEDLLE